VPQSKKLESVLIADLERCASTSVKHRLEEILDSLPESERQALEKTISNMAEKNQNTSLRCRNGFSYKWLAEVLTKHGHTISANQVRHYIGAIYRKRQAK
jgi:hypothetical protein